MIRLPHFKLPFTARIWIGAFLFFTILAFCARWIDRALGRPEIFTGWWLFAIILFLAAFNARKRLSMLPLGKASTWLLLHGVGGVFALALFWLHTGSLWPYGRNEQALALFFYLVTFTGVAGYLLQRVYPPLLSATGREMIYEQIPGEIAALRKEAELAAFECTRSTGSDTLARHYLETLGWFFQRPRFCFNHAFAGRKAKAWVRQQIGAVRRYLNAEEQKYLDRLAALANDKIDVDLHYTVQSIMKGWLLFHLPLSATMMVLVLWHVLLVHIYTL